MPESDPTDRPPRPQTEMTAAQAAGLPASPPPPSEPAPPLTGEPEPAAAAEDAAAAEPPPEAAPEPEPSAAAEDAAAAEPQPEATPEPEPETAPEPDEAAPEAASEAPAEAQPEPAAEAAATSAAPAESDDDDRDDEEADLDDDDDDLDDEEADDDDDDDDDDDGPEDTFAGLGLRRELLSALQEMGFSKPTPIQQQAIPVLLEGKDVLGQAATGTGKTAAFALPLLQSIQPGEPGKIQALVLVPTRELAMQVSEAIYKHGSTQGTRVLPVYGGTPIQRQLRGLSRGVHVVVGTPGRVLDHLQRGSISLDKTRALILDEADEMLDMGFADDLEAILERTSDERQTVLFSATMPPRVQSIAKSHMRDPVRVQISHAESAEARALVRQAVYVVRREHKPAALGRLLDFEMPTAALVFCKMRAEVDELTEAMNARGYRAEALHGGMEQGQRTRVMNRLRDGTAQLLIATDVAARGLDVDILSHVINYNLPRQAESYVHRIGRVGRAGREGVAITLCEPRQRRALGYVEREIRQRLTVLPLPSAAQVRQRQLQLTLARLRESLAADDLSDYEALLDALASDLDGRSIALAAIKMAHEATAGPVDDEPIPDASQRFFEKDKRKHKDRDDRRDRKPYDRGRKGERPQRGKGKGGGFVPEGEVAKIFVGLGRKAGIRAGDLVGAIAGETDLVGRQIGPIRIHDTFAVVGVPRDAAESVIRALRGTTIRGKKASARHFVEKD